MRASRYWRPSSVVQWAAPQVQVPTGTIGRSGSLTSTVVVATASVNSFVQYFWARLSSVSQTGQIGPLSGLPAVWAATCEPDLRGALQAVLVRSPSVKSRCQRPRPLDHCQRAHV